MFHKFDVTVSSIGDAKSLEGGTLLMTPLKGVDGKIYALAQGAVSIGGRNERGAGAESHPTTGTVFNGAFIEREINIDLFHQKFATLSLKESGFSNAVAVQKAINSYYHTQVAVAMDSRSIKLKCPKNRSMVEFLAEVQNIDMDYKPKDKIIINEKTGTIVAGVDIELRRSMWSFIQEINAQGTTIILTTHYLEEAENLCRNIAIIDRGKIVENTSMKSLLNRLDKETFILDLKTSLPNNFTLSEFNYQHIDDTTLEVELKRNDSLNSLFSALNQQGIEVCSMKNKANRLEELFLTLVKKTEATR